MTNSTHAAPLTAPAATTADAVLRAFAQTLRQLQRQLDDPRVTASLGNNPQELRYGLAAFRQRHPAAWEAASTCSEQDTPDQGDHP